MIRDRIPSHPGSGFFFHPGSRVHGSKSTGSRIRIRNTALSQLFQYLPPPSLTEFRQQLLRRKDPVRVVLAESVKGPIQRLGDDPKVGVLGAHLQEPGGKKPEDGGRARLRHPLGRQLRQVAEDVHKVDPNAHHLNDRGVIISHK